MEENTSKSEIEHSVLNQKYTNKLTDVESSIFICLVAKKDVSIYAIAWLEKYERIKEKRRLIDFEMKSEPAYFPTNMIGFEA